MENIRVFCRVAQEERWRDTVEDRSMEESGVRGGERKGREKKKAQRRGRERQEDHSQKEWFGLLTILRKMFITYTEMI